MSTDAQIDDIISISNNISMSPAQDLGISADALDAVIIIIIIIVLV